MFGIAGEELAEIKQRAALADQALRYQRVWCRPIRSMTGGLFLMPPVALPFPITALPGRRPGEGQGDLINCYARKVGQPGALAARAGHAALHAADAPGRRLPRGQLVVDNYLVSVWGDDGHAHAAEWHDDHA